MAHLISAAHWFSTKSIAWRTGCFGKLGRFTFLPGVKLLQQQAAMWAWFGRLEVCERRHEDCQLIRVSFGRKVELGYIFRGRLDGPSTAWR
jgi:hypothetical protein